MSHTNAFERLVFSVMTHPGAPLVERAQAAAAAGYQGIGLRPGDLARARQAGANDAGLRSLLADLGLSVVEIDVLVGWGLDGPAGAKARRHEERIYELADVFGAHHVTVTGDLAHGVEAGAEAFASLCDRAAAHGLIVALEFLPWTDVPDAATAARLVDLAERRNGGVLVDAWHHFRGAGSEEQLLALAPDRVVGVQFDDGLLHGTGSLLEQTFDRELPGEGEFDLPRFLRLLGGMGLGHLPLCVEVISPRLAELPVAEAARRSADATRRVLAQAFAA